jgi:alpha-tubulin suppressor-like RCC1 family protein
MLKLSQSAISISSGYHHSGIVTLAGELFMCGSTLHGKLGLQNLNLMQVTRFNQIPQEVLGSSKIVQVACGDYHTMCLTQNGQVYAWGGTLHGKVGGSSTLNNEPRLV